jgi:phage tail-like protein
MVPALGLTMLFSVSIGNSPLGNWSSCQGLEVNYNAKTFRELGTNDREFYYTEAITYPPLKLVRAMDATNSAVLQRWLAEQATLWDNARSTQAYAGQGAAITLYCYPGSGTPQAVYTWSLRGVYPSKWSGPGLDADKSNVAVETLELMHQGFLPT